MQLDAFQILQLLHPRLEVWGAGNCLLPKQLADLSLQGRPSVSPGASPNEATCDSGQGLQASAGCTPRLGELVVKDIQNSVVPSWKHQDLKL